mgnify:CR=1 FL=1
MYGLVDCNNFYASCERIFKPKLNKKPIIVLSNNDGCVIARSNESKKIGIKMGVPAFKISSLIKKYNIEVFSTNFALYGDISQRVMTIVSEIIPNIEIYSIDEAFLDLKEFKDSDLLSVGSNIRKKILQCTGIPVSIGIAKTKTLSKIANYIAKNNSGIGVFLINEDNYDYLLKDIPIQKIWGVGFKTNLFLKRYGINNAEQLKNCDLKWIHSNLSIVGERMVKELRGISCNKINNLNIGKKSISTSRTFSKMITSYTSLESSIAMYTTRCAEKLRSQSCSAKIAHIFIMTNPFRTDLLQNIIYKTVQFPIATDDTGEILNYILNELKKVYQKGYFYKKAGVILSGIIPTNHVQCDIFDNKDRKKSKAIMSTMDLINKKMGRDSIRYAAQGYHSNLKLRQQSLSPCYTTRWNDLLKIYI